MDRTQVLDPKRRKTSRQTARSQRNT